MELCIALDLPSKEANHKILESVKEHNLWIKVGLRSFIRDGKHFLEEIRSINPGFKIFLDLKLHDIPNTMADAAESVADLGVQMFTVHASSGKEGMQSVRDRLNICRHAPKVLAVTVLTSLGDDASNAIYGDGVAHKAEQFAEDAFNSGMDGIVCSVYESQKIKTITSHDFITLTPGIRPFGSGDDDQKRVADIPAAKENLSDIIVVGRPIYRSEDPKESVEKILAQL